MRKGFPLNTMYWVVAGNSDAQTENPSPPDPLSPPFIGERGSFMS
ncbi:MAG: hypothetical protein AMXMBFR19_16330 [Chthonomonadaceae bacterium]